MREKILPVIKYLAIAFFDTVLNYAVYGLILYLGAHYLIASVAAFMVSTTSAFFLNTKFVFTESGEKTTYTLRGLIKTFCTYGFTGVISYKLLLMFWIELIHIPKMIAPILSTAINFPINFCLNKYWACKQGSSN